MINHGLLLGKKREQNFPTLIPPEVGLFPSSYTGTAKPTSKQYSSPRLAWVYETRSLNLFHEELLYSLGYWESPSYFTFVCAYYMPGDKILQSSPCETMGSIILLREFRSLMSLLLSDQEENVLQLMGCRKCYL